MFLFVSIFFSLFSPCLSIFFNSVFCSFIHTSSLLISLFIPYLYITTSFPCHLLNPSLPSASLLGYFCSPCLPFIPLISLSLTYSLLLTASILILSFSYPTFPTSRLSLFPLSYVIYIMKMSDDYFYSL